MLENERTHIDMIDRQIVALFEERMKVTNEVAQIKKENNIEVLDTSREEIVLKKVTSYLDDQTLAPLLEDFYRELMRLSRQRQLLIIDEVVLEKED